LAVFLSMSGIVVLNCYCCIMKDFKRDFKGQMMVASRNYFVMQNMIFYNK
jgi:hypothetical protein